MCNAPATTILDTGSDVGNYLGVAIYMQGQEGGLSPRGRMLGSMSKSKRRPGPSVKQASPGLRRAREKHPL